MDRPPDKGLPRHQVAWVERTRAQPGLPKGWSGPSSFRRWCWDSTAGPAESRIGIAMGLGGCPADLTDAEQCEDLCCRGRAECVEDDRRHSATVQPAHEPRGLRRYGYALEDQASCPTPSTPRASAARSRAEEPARWHRQSHDGDGQSAAGPAASVKRSPGGFSSRAPSCPAERVRRGEERAGCRPVRARSPRSPRA